MDGDFGSVMETAAFEDCQITGVTCDSRQVEEGYLFAAIPGTQTDGRRFIPDAIGRGAVAILAPPGTELDTEHRRVPLISNDNPRRQYALMAARFFHEQPESVACITGTNGKTSAATFLRQLWGAAGIRSASAGTLGVELGGFADDEVPQLAHAINLTTPDPADLHRSLAELAAHGIDHLALEASSHGLAQYRLDGVRVAAAAFTNLTRDHLDYHGGMEDYLTAKLRLVSEIVVDGGAVVVNADAPYAGSFESAARRRGLRVIATGRAGRDMTLHGLRPDGTGQVLDLETFGRRRSWRLPLPGAFQAANALIACGLAMTTGIAPEAALAGMEELQGVRGRIEHVGDGPRGGAVYVDYAHTPDALGSVLNAFRPHAAGRLAVVFGCGGDRDPGKRPEMGAAAAAAADMVIVTDDNPRGEDPAVIRAQALKGCPEAREIGDRAEAIAAAIGELEAGDVLVIAGKGHETGQIIGDAVHPFDDAEVVRDVLGRSAR